MSTTTATAQSTTTSRRFPLLESGSAAGAVAAVVTTLVAASSHAAGVSFADRTGQSIPVLAFAQLTFIGALLGVALAAGIRAGQRSRAVPSPALHGRLRSCRAWLRSSSASLLRPSGSWSSITSSPP
jgi:hypothetical protein